MLGTTGLHSVLWLLYLFFLSKYGIKYPILTTHTIRHIRQGL